MLKFVFVLSLAINFSLISYAQNGCTDHKATNYKPGATYNDGTCEYQSLHVTPVLRTVLPDVLNETSGIIYTSGLLFTLNDSGNTAEFFCIDTTTSTIVQTVIVDNYPNVDWEDITADSNYIYIGDTGNNDGNRKNLKVLKIAKADFIGKGSIVHVFAQAISYSYSDQTSFFKNIFNNYDCESMMVKGSYIYLFTKDRGDFQTRVYRLSKTPGTYSIAPYTSFNVKGALTDVDYNPELNEVALIGYQFGLFNSFVYLLSDFQGDMFFSGNKRRIEIGFNLIAWQTEGITYVDQNRLFITCEKNDGISASLYCMNKSTMDVTAVLGYASSETNLHAYPNPVIDKLTLEKDELIKFIEVKDLLGKTIYSGEVNDFSFVLNLEDINYNNGLHIINIHTISKTYNLSLVFQR